MKASFLVFLGSGAGGVARYLIAKRINFLYMYSFPLATFIANILACFILGLLLGAEDKIGEHSKLLLAAGFCGGFSTFSTFSGETFLLLQQGNYFYGFLNIGASLLVCLAATVFGHWLMA